MNKLRAACPVSLAYALSALYGLPAASRLARWAGCGLCLDQLLSLGINRKRMSVLAMVP
jgi:hypothetical protein